MRESGTQEMDVRGLPPPEPFERIMHALASLPAESVLRVHIHREPFPLYNALRDKGYAWHTTPQADGSYSISIAHSA